MFWLTFIIHWLKMLGSSAMILVIAYGIIRGTDAIERLVQGPSRPPTCTMGSIEARFGNCEVGQ